MISPFVLAVLKYAFLALLYFFVYRAIRAVVVDLRAPRRAAKSAAKAASAESKKRPPKSRGGRGKPPVIVIVRSGSGKKLASKKLKAPLQIGRNEGCEIRPEDTFLSQFHARLYPKNGAWYVEDLGSTNGTYLNRQRLTSAAELHAGDEVRVGETTLELRR